jgi:hypothetical protein
MKILSFDIGIINMAFCLMESTEDKKVKILDWHVMNISGIPDCSMCKKKAKSYVFLTNHKNPNETSYFCASHTKNYVEKHYAKKEINNIQDSDKMDLDKLGENLYLQLEKIPELYNDIDCILFENQPVLKNPKMKSIQMILYSFFLYKKTIGLCKINTLKFYTAKRKLEIKGIQLNPLEFDKKDYADRKKLSKLITKEILKRINDLENINKLEEETKQDDLCDCFIQGVEHLQTSGYFTLN